MSCLLECMDIDPWLYTDTDLRKMSLFNHELDRRTVDIAALSETRLPDTGSIKEYLYHLLVWEVTGTEARAGCLFCHTQ